MVSCFSLRYYFIMSQYSILHFIFKPDFNTGFLYESWICPCMPNAQTCDIFQKLAMYTHTLVKKGNSAAQVFAIHAIHRKPNGLV